MLLRFSVSVFFQDDFFIKTISNILNSILVLLVAALGVYFSWESRSKDDEIQKQKLRIEKLEKQLNVSFEK